MRQVYIEDGEVKVWGPSEVLARMVAQDVINALIVSPKVTWMCPAEAYAECDKTQGCIGAVCMKMFKRP